MLLKVILFLIAVYLFIGILKQIFQYKNKTNTKKYSTEDKKKKKYNFLIDAEDIPFEELTKNEK
ncbi:MAG: hypothetical protein ACEQSF_05010 [Solirubrobacteraceae bacterium]